jgi:hypothetical protein
VRIAEDWATPELMNRFMMGLFSYVYYSSLIRVSCRVEMAGQG